ncbi:hypothetical protein [Aquiflexum sp.]
MKSIILFCFSYGVCFISLAQKVTVSGTVKDADNGETLIGVNVFDKKN